MNRILFITSRNVRTSSGELRLIKNRAEFLYSKDICTDFIALQRKRKNVCCEEIIAGGSMDVFYINKRPIKCVRNIWRMLRTVNRCLNNNEYDAIILSGPAMPLLCSMVRKRGKCKVLIDVHGACEDVLSLSKGKTALKKIKSILIYRIDTISLKIGLKKSDGAFVVTKYLREYIIDKFGLNRDFLFFVVPCGTISGYSMTSEEYLRNRSKYRKKYNVAKDDIVFLYSGGTSSWQCLSETIAMYKKIENKTSRSVKLLIFSHNKNEIKGFLNGDEKNVIVDSFKPSELRGALCVGDYGFVLRKKDIINEVAFPNKYLEYLSSRLRIITTRFVNEVASQVQMYNLGIVLDDVMDYQTVFDVVQKKRLSSVSLETLSNVLYYNSFEKTLSPFMKYLNKGDLK